MTIMLNIKCAYEFKRASSIDTGEVKSSVETSLHRISLIMKKNLGGYSADRETNLLLHTTMYCNKGL